MRVGRPQCKRYYQVSGNDNLLETLTDIVAAGTIAIATAIGIAYRGHNLYYANVVGVSYMVPLLTTYFRSTLRLMV